MIFKIKKVAPVLALVAFFYFPLTASAINFDLTLTHDIAVGGVTYSLTWNAVDPSTTDAKVSYYVFQEFGNNFSVAPTLGNEIFSTFDTSVSNLALLSNVDLLNKAGSRCFVVISSDSLNGVAGISDVECHSFIHDVSRGDINGTQISAGQKWNFKYQLDYDAYMTADIYPPGVDFTFDTNGFISAASSSPIRSLIDPSRPNRSGELIGKSVFNTEEWDGRSSTGSAVPRGIYFLVLKATFPNTYFIGGTGPAESTQVATRESLLRGHYFFPIPVDYRILNVKSTGITLTNTSASISYDLTFSGLVRMVIAQKGSHFVVDSNGDIQATDATTGAIDSSLIISSKTFQRTFGSNTETWDGTSSTGAVVASGVYAVGLSAKDEYGNRAVDATGANTPIFTTVTLERAPGSTSSGGATDTTAPTLVSISPADGVTSNGQISTMTIVLSDTGGSTLDLVNAAITITSPNSTAVTSYARTNDTTNNTITLVFSPALDTNGTYAVAITAIDVANNTANISSTFNIDIKLDASSFGNSLKIFPNPAKNTTSVTFQYEVAVDATTTIEIYTVLGERITALSFNDLQAPLVTHKWFLTNDNGQKVGSGMYIARIKAAGSGGDIEIKKNIVVIR